MPRTARYAVLGEPGAASELWVVVHGYGQLAARFIRRFAGLPGVASGERAVVAPEALSRFYVEREVGPHGPVSRVGASWMTRADRAHEIRDYLEYLDLVAARVLGAVPEPGASGARPPAGIDPGGRRLVVLGFSQGAETASRWVAHGRIRPAELVLWGGGLAEDLEEARAVPALRDVRVTLVVGDADGWGQRRAAQSEGRLAAWGVPAERVDYRGGHVVDGATLAARWPV